MSRISDEELDQLFRKGLNDNDLEYEKNAWEEMSPLLESKRFDFALLLRVAAVLFVLTASAAIVYKAVQMKRSSTPINSVKGLDKARLGQPGYLNPTDELAANDKNTPPETGRDVVKENFNEHNRSVNAGEGLKTAENQSNEKGVVASSDEGVRNNVRAKEPFGERQKSLSTANIHAKTKPVQAATKTPNPGVKSDRSSGELFRGIPNSSRKPTGLWIAASTGV